ncbi:site-2 protease family protein [Patescibacteria group bacterium]
MTVVPEVDDSGGGVVGVTLAEVGLVRYPFFQAVYEGAKNTVNLLWQILVAFYNVIKDLFSAREVAIDIAGPVGIAVLTGQVARLGIIYLLQFTALLSLNLAIINLLPIPALDGGRLLFLGIEKIRRKPISRKIEGMFHNVGFIVLMLILVVVTVKDVSRFSENIGNFFKNIF